MTLQARMTMPDSQWYPLNISLIDTVEDIVVFLGLKVFNSDETYTFSCNRNAQVTFVGKPQLKIIIFKNDTH